jgi:hypothetical protein
VILIVIFAMRRLQLFSFKSERWRKRPIGLYLVRCVPVACALALVIQVSGRTSWPSPGGLKRAGILRQLERSGQRNLVLVRYDTIRHDTGDEWVYNDADIDGSPVVWARELDRESNTRLMQYFAGRRVWLVEPDVAVPRVVPYEHALYRPMPFVQLGAPGILVLRSTAEVKHKVLTGAQAHGETRFSCDGWNAIFTEATGVAAPNATGECWGNNRGQVVDFEPWFDWLCRQR